MCVCVCVCAGICMYGTMLCICRLHMNMYVYVRADICTVYTCLCYVCRNECVLLSMSICACMCSIYCIAHLGVCIFVWMCMQLWLCTCCVCVRVYVSLCVGLYDSVDVIMCVCFCMLEREFVCVCTASRYSRYSRFSLLSLGKNITDAKLWKTHRKKHPFWLLSFGAETELKTYSTPSHRWSLPLYCYITFAIWGEWSQNGDVLQASEVHFEGEAFSKGRKADDWAFGSFIFTGEGKTKTKTNLESAEVALAGSTQTKDFSTAFQCVRVPCQPFK